jgi:hypothetical protein
VLVHESLWPGAQVSLKTATIIGGRYYNPALALPREYMLRFEHPGTPHDAFIGPSAPSSPEPKGASSSSSATLTAPAASRTTPAPLISTPPLHSASHTSLPTLAVASSSQRRRRTSRPGWKGWAPVAEDYIPHSTTYVDVINRCKSRTRSGRL